MKHDAPAFDLQGRNAVITGGTAGIGLAVARRFKRAGAKVTILGRRANGDDVADAIGARFLRADMRDGAQIGAALQSASAEGLIDVLVLNAGADNTGPMIADHDVSEFLDLLQLNLIGVYAALQSAPKVVAEGGSIIATSSVAASLTGPGYSQYSASKIAVESLVRTAALELAPRSIRVNAIAPGSVATDMLPPDHPEIAVVEALCPLGRVAETDDVVGAYHFLASDESRYVSGQTLRVDGGLSAGVSASVVETIFRGQQPRTA